MVVFDSFVQVYDCFLGEISSQYLYSTIGRSSPQMYFNMPNLKESDSVDLFTLSSKPYMGCLLCYVRLLWPLE